jgi:hypothetical protein
MMKLVAALLLACSIHVAAQTQPPDVAALQRWAGCYDLRVAHEDSAKQIWGKLPRHFQLLLERAHHKRIPNLMVGKVLGEDYRRWPFTFWSVSGSQELKIEWGLMTGYVVRLTMSGNQLVGTAKAFTDYGRDMPTLKVLVQHNSCEQDRVIAE